MKKMVIVALCVAMLGAMTGCGSVAHAGLDVSATQTETYNGITRTEKTVQDGDKEKTTVEYTDEDGNVMSKKDGEAAFNKAKAECEGTSDETDAEENSAEVENQVKDANLKVANNSDATINELKIATNDDDYACNFLKDGEVLEQGQSGTIKNLINYTPSSEFKFSVTTEDGQTAEIKNVTFANVKDKDNIQLNINQKDGELVLEVA